MALPKRLLTGAALLAAGWRLLREVQRTAPAALIVHPVHLTLPRLDPTFDGLRIAHISDIHLDSPETAARFAQAVVRVNAAAPDMIVITGDFVTRGSETDPAALLEPLRALHAPEGVFAVLGNHDHKCAAGPEPLRRVLDAAGVVELPNRVHTLRRGEAALHITGVDDLIWRRARLDLVLAALPEDGAAILLAHEPDFADFSAATGRFDLQLSGHTHGGQIRLPGFGALVLPKYGQRYQYRLYRAGEMALYTNPGLGTVNLHLRFHCPPEITLFTLHAVNGATA